MSDRESILFKWPVLSVFCSESFGGILGEIRDSTNFQAERETSFLRKSAIPELLTYRSSRMLLPTWENMKGSF